MESVTWVMFNAAFPMFDTETVCVACLPTATLPKLTLAGLSWKAACVVVCFPLLESKPAQPLMRNGRITRARRTNQHKFPKILRLLIVLPPTVSA